MKRCIAVFIATVLTVCCFACAEEAESTTGGSIWDAISGAISDAGNWISGAAEDTAEWVSGAAEDTASWVSGAAEDTAEWVSGAATDAGNWISGAATDAWNWTSTAFSDAWRWTSDVATGAWNGVNDFFNPPSTQGVPTIAIESELPQGTLKMYLGYAVKKTGLNCGFTGEQTIGKDDPHYGISMGKFYGSGFSQAMSTDNETFIFLKTVGDELELHFELAQDIDMIGGDTFVTINDDLGGYDKEFGVSPTDFGRGTLIVRHTDYQNNPG